MATNKGFDCVSDLTSHGQQIKDAGYEFVMRYYDSLTVSSKTKLSRAEALHLSSMGLYLVAVFENAPTSAAYFSASQGEADGMAAFHYAVVIVHQPFSTPIYFAVDYDASEQDLQDRIIPYFREVRTWKREHSVGVYGSGFVCRRLLELGLVSFTCLAQSPGWAEYEQFKASGKWNLLQLATETWQGIEIDPLISNGNGGGFLDALGLQRVVIYEERYRDEN